MIKQSYTIPHQRVYRWFVVTIPRKMGVVYVRSLIGTSKAGTAGSAGTVPGEFFEWSHWDSSEIHGL